MPELQLSGPILFLCDDPAKVEAQLNGRQFSRAEAGTLRDDISTDEITPAGAASVIDARLALRPYTGFRAGDRCPIGIGAVKEGGFSVTVAGNRYGKGSSREHSPRSERWAGVRLVIAESFERIYRQNADNVGLFTSTDFGLIDRIARGEPIEVEELVADREPVAAAILRIGGLLEYGSRRMRNISNAQLGDETRPMTLTEKILRRHAVVTDDTSGEIVPGQGAFVRADWRFVIEVYTAMIDKMLADHFGDTVTLADRDTIIGFAEHLTFAHRSPGMRAVNVVPDLDRLYRAHEDFFARHGLKSHGRIPGGEGSEGISHPLMTELYALPGQVVVGTDSHTPHSGALGCIAFGVGSTDMANALTTGAVRMTVPECLFVNVTGSLPAGVTAKDLVLFLLANAKLSRGGGLARVFEFGGPAVESMSIDERATLTNMVAELGGFTGIVAPDETTVEYLREQRGVTFQLEPWMRSDPGATYAEVIEVDASRLSPIVSRPGDPGNGVPLADLKDRPRVDIAYGGTCTGGKRADFDAYHEVLSWALAQGHTVAPGVALYLQFGTLDVQRYCTEKGYLQTFERIGATLLEPACGACVNFGPGASERAGQVTVSAQNRNFPGRSGPGDVWLASPLTVAASAVGGKLMSFAELRDQPPSRPLNP